MVCEQLVPAHLHPDPPTSRFALPPARPPAAAGSSRVGGCWVRGLEGVLGFWLSWGVLGAVFGVVWW